MSSTLQQLDSPWPHRLAMVLCCATFPLIWVGGLVTTYDAGMAVPDWPSTYGYNMFLYPWQSWVAAPWDLFIEHGHRLLGALVGVLTLAFVASVFLRDRRVWMKTVACFALGAVIGQGLLGGARVVLDARQIAMLHGCFGPFFFAFTVALCVFTSRLWKQSGTTDHLTAERVDSKRLLRNSFLLVAFVYLQLILGANLRHIAVDASPSAFRVTVLFHLLFAGVVALTAVNLWLTVWKQQPIRRHLLWPATVICLLVVIQIALGGGTWIVKYAWPGWATDLGWGVSHVVQANSLSQSITVTSHVAVGSLILAVATLIAIRSFRLVPARPFDPWLVAGVEAVA